MISKEDSQQGVLDRKSVGVWKLLLLPLCLCLYFLEVFIVCMYINDMIMSSIV